MDYLSPSYWDLSVLIEIYECWLDLRVLKGLTCLEDFTSSCEFHRQCGR